MRGFPGEANMTNLFRSLFLALVFAGSAFAQAAPDWTNPFPPYRIIGNVYYVGSQGLASYLITTPQGHNWDLSSVTLRFSSSATRIGTTAREARRSRS